MENNISEEKQTVDIFAVANKVSELKKTLKGEIYFINKKGTPFSVNIGSEIRNALIPVFIDDILAYLNKGAETGLTVREYEMNDEESGVLLHTTAEKVENAAKLLNIINTQKKDIETFNEFDHEFKTIKSMVVKFSHDDLDEPIFIVKQVAGSGALNQRTSWELDENGQLKPFEPELGFKVPLDNQVLIIGKDIFIFKQSKFEKIFDYNFKEQLLADKKVEEIMRLFQLSFPEGIDMQRLVRDNKSLAKKISEVDPTEVKQDKLIEYSEDMDLELMADNDGKIIIMDGKDLTTFVGLLNDDFVTSDLTGKKYVIRGKRVLENNEE